MGYWIRRDYLGFGIGAASLVDNVRFQNGRDLITYLENPQDSQGRRADTDGAGSRWRRPCFGTAADQGEYPVEHFEKHMAESVEEVYGQVITQNIADGFDRYGRKEEPEKTGFWH